MKQLIVLINKVPKIQNAIITTFNEEFEKYKRACKKDFLRTEACFSWNFSSTLQDLKKSVFVYPGNKDTEQWIKKFYKVIEENEINN